MTSPSVANQVETLLSLLAQQGLLESACVVLIGSAARGTTHPGSDIDILLVLEREIGSLPLPYEIDAHVFTRAKFLERLQRGDDLACWAIRCGRILSDKSSWWSSIAHSGTYTKAWPNWRQKITHATRRLRNSISLGGSGDIDAAWEECTLAASHIARAVLLRNDIFPLSRLELVAQLSEARFQNLARIMNKLLLGNPNPRHLAQFTSYVKKWLCCLSRDGVEQRGPLRARRGTILTGENLKPRCGHPMVSRKIKKD